MKVNEGEKSRFSITNFADSATFMERSWNAGCGGFFSYPWSNISIKCKEVHKTTKIVLLVFPN